MVFAQYFGVAHAALFVVSHSIASDTMHVCTLNMNAHMQVFLHILDIGTFLMILIAFICFKHIIQLSGVCPTKSEIDEPETMPYQAVSQN
jgi:hypothetical protein